MLLDEERCYRAVAARDARFDGQFITAVRTTRIYCRPSCPAMTPKRANVEFLPTAGAAQQRGYRACRRCQPDAVPGSPDWNIRADLAARAMRLIADGVVEREGVVGLATRLGYSERHLNRVLTAELGAGPLALARAHRAHTARLLIETTPLAMADIAFAAGFASVRQFNDTVREVYGVPPTTLRTEAGRRRGAIPAAAGTLVLRLPYRPPFDGNGLLSFFSARALTGVESVVDGTYRRTLRLPHAAATVALDLQPTVPGNGSRRAAGAEHVVATVRLGDPRDLGPAVARLRRLLDLDADPLAVDALLGADPALAPSVATTPGIRLPGSVDNVETALRAVLGQQVSVAAARTAAVRLAAALGERLPTQLVGAADDPSADTADLLFPTAATIAERGAEVLTGPATRIATVLGLAEAMADGSLVLDAGRDPAELRSALVALPGIGPWTAGYLAIRVLGDPDELLATDLAVRRGAGALGLPSDAGRLVAHGENWKPWRSYAAMHLTRASALTPTATTRKLRRTS
ncbi:DNA-3-methyladenine glycosylase 2 family protein [Pseudonocardia alaniniphila]|uniref:DNA-3-methyladenine glycosylase II n=1 Tax=Pseudonocardia alaniniphila TaxID=75291 RepID=A0ABS9THU9_9PSEU|nr:AlkA N-terminal domain-containing protein [Pseudonocardia alaniniphila]MCH6168125.1 helix-turn-helix domain-containing protein [Pseudonocardia alaniniphila]